MTKYECAIILAHTGICMLEGDDINIFYKYVEKIMGRPIFTHELASMAIANEIKQKSKDDFLDLCAKAKDKEGERINKLKPCPSCGGEAEFIIEFTPHFFLPDSECGYVRCKECKTRTDSVTISAYYSAQEKAIEAWNRKMEE